MINFFQVFQKHIWQHFRHLTFEVHLQKVLLSDSFTQQTTESLYIKINKEIQENKTRTEKNPSETYGNNILHLELQV